MDVQGLPQETQKKTSPWLWIGIGCGSIVVLCVLMAVVLGFVVYNKTRNFTKQFEDPTVRAERVREVLGAKDLPAGYHPMMTLSIPWVLDLAMLSDREMKKEDFHHGKGDHGKAFDKAGFIFVRTPFNKHGRNYDEMFDDKHNPDEMFRNGDVRFHKRDEIGRGVVPGPDGSTLHYVATRGDIRIGRDTVDGITTLIAVECPGDQKLRVGVWFGADPTAVSNAPERNPSADEESAERRDAAKDDDEGEGGASADRGKTPVKKPETEPDRPKMPEPLGIVPGKPAPPAFAGSPADEAAIKEFMSHFAICK